MDNKPICPDCGRQMAKAGFQWSGRHKVQRYRCFGCGKVIVDRVPKKQEGK